MRWRRADFERRARNRPPEVTRTQGIWQTVRANSGDPSIWRSRRDRWPHGAKPQDDGAPSFRVCRRSSPASGNSRSRNRPEQEDDHVQAGQPLYAMIRVKDLEESVAIYISAFGMHEFRRYCGAWLRGRRPVCHHDSDRNGRQRGRRGHQRRQTRASCWATMPIHNSDGPGHCA